MLEALMSFIVTGVIPGTDIQLGFYTSVVLSVGASLLMIFVFMRRRITRIQKTQMLYSASRLIELITL